MWGTPWGGTQLKGAFLIRVLGETQPNNVLSTSAALLHMNTSSFSGGLPDAQLLLLLDGTLSTWGGALSLLASQATRS